MMTDDARSLALAIAAREDGFEVAPDAPLWLFLPAVWPVESRTWIRDNRIRRLRTTDRGQVGRPALGDGGLLRNGSQRARTDPGSGLAAASSGAAVVVAPTARCWRPGQHPSTAVRLSQLCRGDDRRQSRVLRPHITRPPLTLRIHVGACREPTKGRPSGSTGLNIDTSLAPSTGSWSGLLGNRRCAIGSTTVPSSCPGTPIPRVRGVRSARPGRPSSGNAAGRAIDPADECAFDRTQPWAGCADVKISQRTRSRRGSAQPRTVCRTVSRTHECSIEVGVAEVGPGGSWCT